MTCAPAVAVVVVLPLVVPAGLTAIALAVALCARSDHGTALTGAPAIVLPTWRRPANFFLAFAPFFVGFGVGTFLSAVRGPLTGALTDGLS